MRNVRIYKDDIRQHILKSLFLTDSTIFIGGGLCIAAILYLVLQYVLHLFSWNVYLALLVVLEIAFIATVTHRIDNQPIYKVFPRYFRFSRSSKNYRHKEMEPYFTDFQIQDNLIVRKNNLLKIYRIEPFDISLLNDQDREHFFLNLKQTIHTLPSQVQIITRKESAKPEHYSKHIFSLYAQSNHAREPLINGYVNDLTSLIKGHMFTNTAHYAVFSVSCNPRKTHEKLAAINKLHDMGMRFSGSLAASNIEVYPVINQDLESFTQSILR